MKDLGPPSVSSPLSVLDHLSVCWSRICPIKCPTGRERKERGKMGREVREGKRGGSKEAIILVIQFNNK